MHDKRVHCSHIMTLVDKQVFAGVAANAARRQPAPREPSASTA
jgi:hypothetical protein